MIFYLFIFSIVQYCVSAQAVEQIAQTPPYKTLYLGIAGPGEGVGMAGHAFVAFAYGPHQLFQATVYQYNQLLQLSQEELESNNLGRIYEAYKNGNMILTREPAPQFIERYRSENRSILLYEINLTPEKIDRIFKKIEIDFKDRLMNKKSDYSVVSNNCLTRVIDLINEEAESEKKIDTAWSLTEGFDYEKALSAQKALSNVPFVMIRILNKHPLVKKSPTLFKPKIYNKINAYLEIQKSFEEFCSLCGLEMKEKEWILKLIYQNSFRESESLLKFFNRQVKKCPKSDIAQGIFNEMLIIFEQLAETTAVKQKIRRYNTDGIFNFK